MSGAVLAAMLRRAGAMTLLVYALHTLAAALLGAPLSDDFAGALARNLFRAHLAADDSALLLELGARRIPTMLGWSGSCALAYAALAPLLVVAWTSAMHDGSGSTRTHLERGLRRYPAALGLALLALIAGAVALAGALAGLWLIGSFIALPAAGESAVRAGCVFLAGGAWLGIGCVRDLASSALASSGVASSSRSLRGALAHAIHALSPRALVLRACSIAAVAVCFACAELIGRNATPIAPLGVLAAQQALVFAATLARGAWLAVALDATQRPARSATEHTAATLPAGFEP